MASRRPPKRPDSRTPSRLSSGPVPSEFEETAEDTNVDERPDVPLSTLDDAGSDTTIDEAPTLDPTTQRPRVPVATGRAPARERVSVRRHEPAPPQRAPEPKQKLRLPLPPGATPKADRPAPLPTAPAVQPMRATTEQSEPTKSEIRRMPVPTYAGPERSAKWPFVLAASVVAMVAVAFVVGSSSVPDTDDPTQQTTASRARRAREMAAERSRSRDKSQADPTATADLAAMLHLREKTQGPAKHRAAAVPPAYHRPGLMNETNPHMPMSIGISDKGENEPEYDEAPARQPLPMLEIQVQPPGTLVYLDDIMLGGAPIFMSMEPDRTKGTIRLEMAGYKPKQLSLTVDGVRTYTFAETLEKDPGYEQRIAAARELNKTLKPGM